MGSVLVLYFFVLLLIVLHMGDSFHFCERVDNVEYISIYTISGHTRLFCTLFIYVLYFYT